MNFAEFIDDNRQSLVNDLNTVKHNLLSIFNLYNDSNNTETFRLKINGLSGIYGRIENNKIVISVTGLSKYRKDFSDSKTLENVNNALLPKLNSTIKNVEIRSYSNPHVSISFDRLTKEAVKDIMVLVQGTDAELKPSQIGRF